MYVPVIGPEGNEWVDENLLSDANLSTIGAHRNAVGAVLDDPDDPAALRQLADFEGDVVAGIPLLTDPERIAELDAEDRLDIEQFYEEGPPR